jgi:hypothetical protein
MGTSRPTCSPLHSTMNALCMPRPITGALHTYMNGSDVRKLSVSASALSVAAEQRELTT